MKRNRQELEKTLYLAIDSSKDNYRKNIASIESKLALYNISVGKARGIYSKSIPLVSINNSELYLFTKALYETTGYEVLEINKWFMPEEIQTYNQYRAEVNYKSNIIILKNVDQAAENHFICTKAMYKEMANIFSQGLVTYNSRTQREAKVITFGSKYIEIPDIRETPVLEMTDLMLKGKFKANTITLNIRKIGTEKYEYDIKNRTLKIETDNESYVDIIDGMHRCQAMIRTIEIDPNNEGYTAISIFHYSEQEAQEYIAQEDHRTPINKVHIAAYKNSNEYVAMTKELNKYGNEKNNELFNKIATDLSEIETQGKYVTVDTFSKALKYNFKFENARNISKTQDFLIKFFNETIGILKEKNLSEEKIFTNNMFIGYVALASNLIKEETQSNWKSLLENILTNLFVKNKVDWEGMGIQSKNINTPLIKRISEYFKKAGVEYV